MVPQNRTWAGFYRLDVMLRLHASSKNVEVASEVVYWLQVTRRG